MLTCSYEILPLPIPEVYAANKQYAISVWRHLTRVDRTLHSANRASHSTTHFQTSSQQPYLPLSSRRHPVLTSQRISSALGHKTELSLCLLGAYDTSHKYWSHAKVLTATHSTPPLVIRDSGALHWQSIVYGLPIKPVCSFLQKEHTKDRLKAPHYLHRPSTSLHGCLLLRADFLPK